MDELVGPSHTALLVIHMQRDFVYAAGALGTQAVDLSSSRACRPRKPLPRPVLRRAAAA
jgi:nicotinamidase-related amidase